MTLTSTRRRMRKRIHNLPTATHNCESYGIWVRRPKVTGRLVCVVCGKP